MRAKNTLKSYRYSWTAFESWSEAHSLTSLPATPDTVLLWAASLLSTGSKVATVAARIAAIAFTHRQAGYPTPVDDKVRMMMAGARRVLRQAPNMRRALTVDQLRRISLGFDTNQVRDSRDRAIFVLGFAGAFRRSEIRNLDLADVSWSGEGLLVHMRFSKTDQAGEGRDVAIFAGRHAATCPVRLVDAWLALRGRDRGPLFPSTMGFEITSRRLSPEAMGQILIRGLKRIGLDTHLYSGHSLRAGYVTAAAENGATELAVMKQTGHKSVEMVHRYFRPVQIFATNPLKNLL